MTKRDTDDIESNGWRITVAGRYYTRRAVISFLKFETWRTWSDWNVNDTGSIGGIKVVCTAHDPRKKAIALQIE